MKSIIKKLLPKFVIRLYHWFLAILSACIYGHPAGKMTVIGVTGTKGKTTTSYFITKILEEAGYKVGLTSTAIFKINKKEWLNPTKMTMLGRFALQKLLRDMVRAGCKYAVVETSSEGILQYRHIGINYDVAVFTNLTPEHLESHGGFENYKKAKGKMFARHPKIIIVNADDKYADYFLSFPADKKIKYSLAGNKHVCSLRIGLPGKMNQYNALAAITTAKALGVDEKTAKSALEKIKIVPGRMEFIDKGQNFKVIVDYAHEPESFKQLYETVDKIPHKKIIHVFGATGGGRDKSRRPEMGKIASEKSDTIIITTDDPYDEDPAKISEDVLAGIKSKNKILNILDRKEAIKKALELAQKDDIILITGKGAEQAMCVAGGRKIPWDDREIVKKFLKT